jgi:hypothetical protein
MFTVVLDAYILRIYDGDFPSAVQGVPRRAKLADDFDPPNADGRPLLIAVDAPDGETVLEVFQRYEQHGGAVWPSLVLVPETSTLFLGIGERLLCYNLAAPARLWEAHVDMMFWGWSRHGDVVLMESELELAGFDLCGRRLWTAYFEPPHEFRVEGDHIHATAYQLNHVRNFKGSFPLHTGP